VHARSMISHNINSCRRWILLYSIAHLSCFANVTPSARTRLLCTSHSYRSSRCFVFHWKIYFHCLSQLAAMDTRWRLLTNAPWPLFRLIVFRTLDASKFYPTTEVRWAQTRTVPRNITHLSSLSRSSNTPKSKKITKLADIHPFIAPPGICTVRRVA